MRCVGHSRQTSSPRSKHAGTMRSASHRYYVYMSAVQLALGYHGHQSILQLPGKPFMRKKVRLLEAKYQASADEVYLAPALKQWQDAAEGAVAVAALEARIAERRLLHCVNWYVVHARCWLCALVWVAAGHAALHRHSNLVSTSTLCTLPTHVVAVAVLVVASPHTPCAASSTWSRTPQPCWPC